MDQRLKDLASLVGTILAEKWHKLQQKKKPLREEADGSEERGDARQPSAPGPT